MIYSGKGVVFPHCGQGEGYCFSGGRACVYRTKEVRHPASLPLSSASHFISLQCVAREAACSSSGWLVWSGWEDGVCGAVCCGLRFTTGTIPPPASTLAAHCSPGKGPYPLLPIPSCLWRNASGPRTLKTRPLFLFCFTPPSPFFFFICAFECLRPSLCVCWSLFAWLSTILVMPLGHHASHLI